MFTLHVDSKYRRPGNWIINLVVLLWNSNIIMAEFCEVNNETLNKMPSNWPCQWNDGVIPFVFDFFALSPRRLMSLVKKAHSYIQDRSCLVFKEVNPIDGALEADFTYLFYTYSEVLENCCLKFFSKSENEHYGRRFILITPTCFLQVEVAHATLHGLGLDHAKTGFSEGQARSVLFPYKCKDMDKKLELLERNFKILT